MARIIGGSKPTAYTFVASTLDSSDPNASSVTINVAWGDAASTGGYRTRHLIIGIATVGGPGTISGVTVGGVAATEVVNAPFDDVPDGTSSIWIVSLPTGTSGDVVVSGSDLDAVWLSVWAAYNLNSATATDTASDIGATAGPSDLSVDVLAGGAVFAIAVRGAAGQTLTWTGVTEDATFTVGSFTTWAASAFNVPAATPRTVSALRNGTNRVPCSAASFR